MTHEFKPADFHAACYGDKFFQNTPDRHHRVCDTGVCFRPWPCTKVRWNLKTEVPLWKRIHCFLILRRWNFKVTITGHIGFVFEENSGREITRLSRRHRFRKVPFSKCVPPQENGRRFRIPAGLVWMVGLTVEIKLRFKISSVKCRRWLKAETHCATHRGDKASYAYLRLLTLLTTKFCRSDNDFRMSHETICCSNLSRRRVTAICRVVCFGL